MALGLLKISRRLFDWGNQYDVKSLDLAGLKITNVGTPEADTDAANKAYVDGAEGISGCIRADGTIPMDADLSMGTHKVTGMGDPSDNQDAVTLAYLVSQLGLYVKKDGTVAMLGDLPLGGHKITGLGTGSEDTDALTKAQIVALVSTAAGMVDTKTNRILRGKATLTDAATGITEVVFGASTPATMMGSIAGPWDLSDPGDGGTIIIDPDGDGDQTATLNATAGTHIGAAGASTDMSASAEDKFKISVDGAEAVEVECDFFGKACDNGTKIAAEMQANARTATGTELTVTFSTEGGDHYIFTSPTLGTNSSIEITPADDHDCTEELMLGTANGGVDAQGTGDCADITAVTPAELIALCDADMDGLVITEGTGDDAGKLIFTSDSVGGASSITVGAGTLNTALGFTTSQADYGAAGLGYDGVSLDHSGDNEYSVALLPVGVDQDSLGGKGLGVANKAASGFNIVCETAAAAHQVDIVVIGLEAST